MSGESNDMTSLQITWEKRISHTTGREKMSRINYLISNVPNNILLDKYLFFF